MAKKLREEDLVLNIIVNGKQSHKEMSEVGRKMRDAKVEVNSLVKQQKELERTGKKNTVQYKGLSEEIAKGNAVVDRYRAKIKELGDSMSLSDKSIHQLRQSLSQLSKLKNQAVPGTAQYKEYEQQIQVINGRLTELGVRGRQTGDSLKNMGSGMKQYFTSVVAGVASFTAVAMGIRKAITEYAEFDDRLADVQKTTNLAKEEVKELNAELEKISTRTSQEDLLGLARIGGKLGLSDLDELRGFTESMNMIVVALNEDLGGNVEETVNKMGKLVSIFGVKEEFGIEQSILKVGSAINELGMASEANEGYLVEFSNRMAGIAPLAGISIQEILGLGATLDQFGQSSEVASTALSKLFLNMSKDAKTFSKYAGMEVNAFKKLLETDFMAAFKKVLEGVKGNSAGINELAATLGDLGLDGQRVIGVIGTLANQHEVLTEQIDLSNKAFDEGTSIIDEYNVKNETAAAKLDISKKEVKKFWRELGENLNPAFTKGNNLLVTFIQLLISLINFISNNIKWISALALGFIAYQTAVLASTVAIKAARIATLAFNAAVRVNPIIGLIAALTTVGTLLYNYTRSLSSAQAVQESLNETNKQALKDSLAERLEIERNQKILASETARRDDKLDAIRRLRTIMPDVLKDYDDEQILAGKATKAIKEQTKAILEQAQQRAYANKVTQLTSEKIDIEDKLSKGWRGASLGDKFTAQVLTPRFKKTPEEIYLEKVQNELKNKEAEILKFAELIYGKDRSYGSQIGIKKALANPFANEQSTKGNEIRFGTESNEDPVVVTGSGADDKKQKEYEKLLQQQQDYQDAVILKTKSLLEQEEVEFQNRLKKAGIFGIEKENMSVKQLQVLEALELEHSSNMQKINEKLKEENAKKQAEYRQAQMEGLDEIYIKDVQQQREYYLEKLRLIDEMDISEQEKIIERDKLKAEYDRIEQEREREKLTARLLILEQSIAIGDLEIAEAKRVAEEIAKIKGELLSQEIKDADDAAKEKEKLDEKEKQATKRIEEAKSSIYKSGAKILAEIFKKNKALSMSFLALEKASAIAHVITNAQKEIAIHRVTAAAMGPIAGPAYLTKQILAVKMSSAASIATIAAQAISEAGRTGGSSGGSDKDSGSSGPSFTPRIPGREKGGTLVQRDQDGKYFNASLAPNKRGYVQKPTVIVGENGSEFVANAQAVANPSVKAFLDIIDTAQRNGSISTLNLQKVMTRNMTSRMQGYQKGGYIDSKAANNSYSNSDILSLDELNRNQKELVKAMGQLNTVLQKGITAEVALLGKNGFIEKQRELTTIEDNANL